MKLLLDENLFKRLLPSLLDRFPGSDLIRLFGLGGDSDGTLLDVAIAHDLVLVTKDEDFLALSVRRGFPPKVVCLAIGNVSKATTSDWLLSHADELERFVAHPQAGFLLLDRMEVQAFRGEKSW